MNKRIKKKLLNQHLKELTSDTRKGLSLIVTEGVAVQMYVTDVSYQLEAAVDLHAEIYGRVTKVIDLRRFR